MKKYLFTCLLLLAALFVGVIPLTFLSGCSHKEVGNIIINDQYTMSYAFAEKPKMGSSVLKVTVFDGKGNQSTDLNVMIGYDMPAMRGHHGLGSVLVSPNKNNVYLLPVEFVMPGKWEITLIFSKNNQTLHTETMEIDI